MVFPSETTMSPKRSGLAGTGQVLVDCPGDSFSSDAALRISVGPSDGLSAFGVGLNILH
jgi:hypothetical protein